MAEYKQSAYMADAVISAATSLGVSPDVNVANAARSGQLGVAGARLTKLDGASPAIFNPVVCIVLSTPALFDKYPKMTEMIVGLIENHAKSITGIDFGYTLETADVPIGHDGQNLKVPTRTTRGQVSPSVTFTELTGNLIWNVFRQWIFAVQNPDTNSSTMSANISNEADIPEWLISAYSMSMLCIQYDPTGLPDRIYDAYIIANMFPTETGEGGFERTINTTQTKERTISFTGVVQHNANTRLLGVNMAKLLNIHKINPEYALPGLNGVATAEEAITPNIMSAGGIKYEALGASTDGSDGAVAQYTYKGEGGNGAYSDILGDSSEPLARTPAFEANTTSS